MSVVKSKRSQSKVEFESIFFAVADNIDTLVEHNFFVDFNTMNCNKTFLQSRGMALERLSDGLLYYIKIANSIYPQCLSEWEERRLAMDKAIGICYAILTNYQRIMMRLRIRDDKYNNDILAIVRMINSLKAWRKSDNKLKASLAGKA